VALCCGRRGTAVLRPTHQNCQSNRSPPRMGPVSPPAAPLRAQRARARARPRTRGGPVKTPTCDVAFERERDAFNPAGTRPSHVKRNAATQLECSDRRCRDHAGTCKRHSQGRADGPRGRNQQRSDPWPRSAPTFSPAAWRKAVLEDGRLPFPCPPRRLWCSYYFSHDCCVGSQPQKIRSAAAVALRGRQHTSNDG